MSVAAPRTPSLLPLGIDNMVSRSVMPFVCVTFQAIYFWNTVTLVFGCRGPSGKVPSRNDIKYMDWSEIIVRSGVS